MAALLLVLFPIVYLFHPRLAFGVLVVGIVLLYQQRTPLARHTAASSRTAHPRDSQKPYILRDEARVLR